MPEPLVIAHSKLDKAVLGAYGLKQSASKGEIFTRLIDLYLDALPSEPA
jgi:hypothetical protein